MAGAAGIAQVDSRAAIVAATPRRSFPAKDSANMVPAKCGYRCRQATQIERRTFSFPPTHSFPSRQNFFRKASRV